jgi:O-antigen/teichoic acid export membrane protein
MPKYIENYDSGNRKGMLDIWQKSVNYVALVNFPCFVLLFYFAKDLVILVYTEAYIASAPVFQGFLFLLLLQLTSYGGILRVTGKTSVILYATIITVPLNIVLAILLVQYYGFLGPVIATVACGLVGSLYMLRCIASIVEVKFHKIFPWSSLARTLMAALLSALILLPARKLGIENRLFIMIIEGCLYSLSFVAMAILLKAIPEKEYAFITSQFHSVRRFLFGSEHNVS